MTQEVLPNDVRSPSIYVENFVVEAFTEFASKTFNMYVKVAVTTIFFLAVSEAFVVDFVRDLFSSCSDAKNNISPVQGKIINLKF